MVLPGAMADSIDYLLTYQWNMAQRQDVIAFLTEPGSGKSFHDLQHLPGVISSEPIRSVQARLRYGHHSRKLAITGMTSGSDLNRLLDAQGNPMPLPENGLVMSAKLAEVLGARIGDEVSIEIQEGARPVRNAVISGLIEDFSGVAAYMDLQSLRRFMREGDTINGAYLTVDGARWDDFMRKVKDTPRASVVLVKKEQLASFRNTTGQSIGIIRKLYFVLATIVAFGVVYNSARIALSERGRDLATLRVVGFTQGEVASVLLGELSILVISALPLGLLFGRGITTFIISSLSTETVRLPLTVSLYTYTIAIMVVVIAACASFAVVARMLNKLDLVGVLKARD
jgi:putative ABC transport system permease protein